MRKRLIAESILALFAGRERATAMYGDLAEMAAARGRGWFVAAYVRTLAIVSWRIIATVVFAMSLYQFLGNSLFNRMLGPSGPHLPILLVFWFDPKFLWFVLPITAMLYGVRDRFVQLTAVAALGTSVAFLFLPRFSLAGVVTALGLISLVLTVSGWLRQAAVLAATLTCAFWSAIAAGIVSMFLRSHNYIPAYGHGITGLEPMLAFRGSMLASAYLCVRLHRWLLENPRPANPFNSLEKVNE